MLDTHIAHGMAQKRGDKIVSGGPAPPPIIFILKYPPGALSPCLGFRRFYISFTEFVTHPDARLERVLAYIQLQQDSARHVREKNLEVKARTHCLDYNWRC